MKILKGTFSDMNTEQEYDVVGFKILPESEQIELTFFIADKTKTGKTIGKIKLALGIAEIILPCVNYARLSETKLSYF